MLEETIVSRFERQVAAFPDNLAIVTDDISLTYRALDLKANRIAAELASLPSPRDQPIVLFMKDEAARVAAMLGALKANRIFIPLAPNSPENGSLKLLKTREPRRSSSTVLPARSRACGHWQRHCHGGRAARSIIGAVRGRSDRLSR